MTPDDPQYGEYPPPTTEPPCGPIGWCKYVLKDHLRALLKELDDQERQRFTHSCRGGSAKYAEGKRGESRGLRDAAETVRRMLKSYL